MDTNSAKLLAQVLTLLQWAGNAEVDAATIFGLSHGFETVLRENNSIGISEETQEAVEAMLQAVQDGTQSVDGMQIKDHLRRIKVSESDARNILRLCYLEERYTDEIKVIAEARGSVFRNVIKDTSTEWFGAMNYMELQDTTEGVHRVLHAVYGPTVPKIGEAVHPEGGSAMRVVDVVYKVVTMEKIRRKILVPYVILESEDEPQQ